MSYSELEHQFIRDLILAASNHGLFDMPENDGLSARCDEFLEGDFKVHPEPVYIKMPPEFDPSWIKVLRQDEFTGPDGSGTSKEAFYTRIGWVISAYEVIVKHLTGGKS